MSADDWTIRLTYDEALVLADYLSRWESAEDYSLTMDYAERAAFVRLAGSLESADDGTAFKPDYAGKVAAAKARLLEQYGELR